MEDCLKRARLIGVTGGIAAGKSTVLNQLSRLGARTLDADCVVHRQYRTSSVLRDRLFERWGTAVVSDTGAVDRAAVGRIVFADADELEWLNSVVHPLVKAEIEEEKTKTASPLYCAIPLLFEVGWGGFVDITVCVWCDAPTQLERIRSRGWGRDDLFVRERQQLSMSEKLHKADYGIINNSSTTLLREQCVRLYRHISEQDTLSRRGQRDE